MGEGQLARFCRTLPYEGAVAEALLPDGEYNFVYELGSVQLAIAGAMVAADLIRTAGIDPSAACANSDSFGAAFSPRVVGFTDGRLWTLTSWHAAVGQANGAGFDQRDQLAFRGRWPGAGAIRRRTDGTGDAQCG